MEYNTFKTTFFWWNTFTATKLFIQSKFTKPSSIYVSNVNCNKIHWFSPVMETLRVSGEPLWPTLVLLYIPAKILILMIFNS